MAVKPYSRFHLVLLFHTCLSGSCLLLCVTCITKNRQSCSDINHQQSLSFQGTGEQTQYQPEMFIRDVQQTISLCTSDNIWSMGRYKAEIEKTFIYKTRQSDTGDTMTEDEELYRTLLKHARTHGVTTVNVSVGSYVVFYDLLPSPSSVTPSTRRSRHWACFLSFSSTSA